jgi:hypothetical protein
MLVHGLEALRYLPALCTASAPRTRACRYHRLSGLLTEGASLRPCPCCAGGAEQEYADGVAKIPAAAVAVEDAESMARMQERGQKITVRLYMEAQSQPDELSHNVVAEWIGSEKPDEVVLVSGHLDSWVRGLTRALSKRLWLMSRALTVGLVRMWAWGPWTMAAGLSSAGR